GEKRGTTLRKSSLANDAFSSIVPVKRALAERTEGTSPMPSSEVDAGCSEPLQRRLGDLTNTLGPAVHAAVESPLLNPSYLTDTLRPTRSRA
ncbi:MAG: hypothetical protein JWO86_3298, partial [Myxococcaceae bacterium]|nr:hypothetical protein [Myxococcaceae bacterium]